MKAAADALQKLAADPQYLGARLGILAVLHTWTRAMKCVPLAELRRFTALQKLPSTCFTTPFRSSRGPPLLHIPLLSIPHPTFTRGR